jgi:SAM-dependent methyltransferase
MVDIFTGIYKHNLWSGRQSRSGTGSDLEETKKIRRDLPGLFKELKVKSILDIPCGDLNWIAHVLRDYNKHHVFDYIGADIVPQVVEDARNYYPYGVDSKRMDFRVLDITGDELPTVDLILTRDCLGHLSNANVVKAVENVKRAGPKYFVTTHWPLAKYTDIQDGSWRPINMDHYLDDSFQLVSLIEEDIKDKLLAVYAIIN